MPNLCFCNTFFERNVSRIKDSITKVKETKFQSKQMGSREMKSINMEGRVQFDVFVVSLLT